MDISKKINWIDKNNMIILGFWFAFIIGIGIVNETYLLTILYIGAFSILTFIVKPESIYDTTFELMMVSMIFDYTIYFPGMSKLYSFHIIFFIFSVMNLIKLFKNRDVFLRLDKKIIKILAIFFIFIAISFTWAISKELALKYISIYVMMIIFIIDMLIYNISKEQLSKTIRIIISLFVFIVLVGAVETVTGNQLPVIHSFTNFDMSALLMAICNSRPIAFSYNVNNYACMLALLVPFILFTIYKIESKFVKVIVAFFATLSFGLVIMTASRTGSIAMVIVFGTFFLGSFINIKKLKGINVIILILMVTGTVLLFKFGYLVPNVKPVYDDVGEIIKTDNQNMLADKIGQLKDVEVEYGEEGADNIRGTIAKSILDGVFIQKNFAGYGVGNSEGYLRIDVEGKTQGVYSPHGLLLELLGDFGVFGVALYGVLYLYLLIKNIMFAKNMKDSISIASVIALVALAPASFGPSSITYIFLYWTVLSLAASNIQIKSIKEV